MRHTCRQEASEPTNVPAHEQTGAHTISGWAAQQQQERFLGSTILQLVATLQGFEDTGYHMHAGDQASEDAYERFLHGRRMLVRQLSLSLQVKDSMFLMLLCIA